MSNILITGAARRIGRELALDLATAGHDLALHYHGSEAEALDLKAKITAMGRKACLLCADLGSSDIGEDLISRGRAELGSVEVLINNAAIYEEDDLGSLSAAGFDRHMAINLRAPILLAQAFARQSPALKGGNIINLIDQRVLKLNPRYFSYMISKSALWTATRTMAQALAPKKIRVNAIGPGPALPSKRQSLADFAREESLTLLQHGTTPGEIAAAVKFILASPALTGQMLVLDGGQHLLWQTVDLMEAQS